MSNTRSESRNFRIDFVEEKGFCYVFTGDCSTSSSGITRRTVLGTKIAGTSLLSLVSGTDKKYLKKNSDTQNRKGIQIVFEYWIFVKVAKI